MNSIKYVWILVCVIPILGEGITVFDQTNIEYRVENKYTRESVRGKEILDVEIVQKKVYYIYVKKGHITTVHFPYPIVNILKKSTESKLQTKSFRRDDGRPIENRRLWWVEPLANFRPGEVFEIEFVCENNFKTTFKIISEYPEWQHNSTLYLLDARQEQNNRFLTPEGILLLKTQYEKVIENRNNIISELAYHPIQKIPIGNQLKTLNNGILRLENILIVNGYYYYYFTYEGVNALTLDEASIVLFVTKLGFLGQSGERLSKKPIRLTRYTEKEGEQTLFSVVFQLDPSEQYDVYRSELLLDHTIRFTDTVDKLNSIENGSHINEQVD